MGVQGAGFGASGSGSFWGLSIDCGIPSEPLETDVIPEVNPFFFARAGHKWSVARQHRLLSNTLPLRIIIKHAFETEVYG